MIVPTPPKSASILAGSTERYADAYFINGSLLVADSKTDMNGKIAAPPGTVEALRKYLEHAPNGAHVNDVQQMLAYLGIAPKLSKAWTHRHGARCGCMRV